MLLFRVIDSESDALPVGPERAHWSTAAPDPGRGTTAGTFMQRIATSVQ
jgi:hypothetical protein